MRLRDQALKRRARRRRRRALPFLWISCSRVSPLGGAPWAPLPAPVGDRIAVCATFAAVHVAAAACLGGSPSSAFLGLQRLHRAVNGPCRRGLLRGGGPIHGAAPTATALAADVMMPSPRARALHFVPKALGARQRLLHAAQPFLGHARPLLHRRPCILANGRVQVEEGAEDGRQGGEEAAEAQEERSRRAAFATHRLVVMEKVLEKGTGHTQAARVSQTRG